MHQTAHNYIVQSGVAAHFSQLGTSEQSLEAHPVLVKKDQQHVAQGGIGRGQQPLGDITAVLITVAI